MNEITFRKAQTKDAEKLVEMRLLQLHEEGERPTCDLKPLLFDYYLQHLANETFISWLAIDGEEIIATSGLSFAEKPPYYTNPTGMIGLVSNMYTKKDYRRRGIARALLNKIVEEAVSHGCGVVHVTASHEGVFLYNDFGFVRHANFLQYVCG